MKFLKIIILFFFSIFTKCCVAQLYLENKRIVIVALNTPELQQLQYFLSKFDSALVQDTVIIAYNFNHEHCWDIMDQQPPKQIQGFIERSQKRVTKTRMERPFVSVFQFIQTGKNFNKLKKWDTTILIDSTDQLRNLLFKNKCTCGSSAVVLPDGIVIITRSDAHFEALDYDKNKIQELLAKYK